MQFPQKLQNRLASRASQNALRKLTPQSDLIDFASNDYLGMSRETELHERIDKIVSNGLFAYGATGSRLLTGNHYYYQEAEAVLSKYHNGESALIFNSGYDANIGFFSCVPQRDDVVLYDELSHASIRDGIRMGNAKAYKFGHNDDADLEILIERHKRTDRHIYVVTESVFSMDGDSPNLEIIAGICERHQCLLVVDEAHAVGVFGAGLVENFQLSAKVFARIVTFGKGIGGSGAAVIGSEQLKQYLINFARSLIYTTALPPHAVATIIAAYDYLSDNNYRKEKLQENIAHFGREKTQYGLKPVFVRSKSAVQCAIIPGNDHVRTIANELQSKGFDVRAILSPTVPEGQERLRFCIHSYNTPEQISEVLKALAELLF